MYSNPNPFVSPLRWMYGLLPATHASSWARGLRASSRFLSFRFGRNFRLMRTLDISGTANRFWRAVSQERRFPKTARELLRSRRGPQSRRVCQVSYSARWALTLVSLAGG